MKLLAFGCNDDDFGDRQPSNTGLYRARKARNKKKKSTKHSRDGSHRYFPTVVLNLLPTVAVKMRVQIVVQRSSSTLVMQWKFSYS